MSGLDEPATVIWFATPEPDTELGRPCNSASFDTLREAVLFMMGMSVEERESANDPDTRWKGIGLSGHRSDGQKGKSAEQITAKRAISQTDGCRANAMMRGRPCPLQRGQCTSRSARRTGASVSRGFTRRFKSTTVPQLSQAIISQ
jgi:hypothetical protein